MEQQQLIMSLYLATMIMTLVAIISVGLLIWFRRAVIDQFKLKKLIKYGYIIARLKRHDKTEIQVVVIPDKETSGVRFPGVEGLYTIDDASVILKDRKYPVYEWREGETAPLNYNSDWFDTEVTCPACKENIKTRVEKMRSMNPSVLDNLILKIKTLSEMGIINKWLIMCLIGIAVLGVGIGVTWFWVDDFKKRAGEIIVPKIIEACRQAAANLQCIK